MRLYSPIQGTAGSVYEIQRAGAGNFRVPLQPVRGTGNAAIEQFCRFNYGVTFQIFEKGDVRGETAQPLFKFLTKEKGFEGFDMNHPIAGKLEEALKANFPEYLEGDGIKWNFTKFLIDREGNVVKRFEPTAAPEDMEKDIEVLL